MSSPSRRRRMGREAFMPDADPNDLNPWYGRFGWLAESYENDFNEGWQEAKADYEKGLNDEENECKCSCGSCCCSR